MISISMCSMCCACMCDVLCLWVWVVCVKPVHLTRFSAAVVWVFRCAPGSSQQRQIRIPVLSKQRQQLRGIGRGTLEHGNVHYLTTYARSLPGPMYCAVVMPDLTYGVSQINVTKISNGTETSNRTEPVHGVVHVQQN